MKVKNIRRIENLLSNPRMYILGELCVQKTSSSYFYSQVPEKRGLGVISKGRVFEILSPEDTIFAPIARRYFLPAGNKVLQDILQDLRNAGVDYTPACLKGPYVLILQIDLPVQVYLETDTTTGVCYAVLA